MKKHAMFNRTVMSYPLATLLSGGVSAKWKQFACNASLALSLGHGDQAREKLYRLKVF